MVMTEKMLAEFLEAVKKRVEDELKHIHTPIRKLRVEHIVKIVKNELRNYVAIGTLSPANFPVGLIHDGDYCDETCASKLGWAGAHEIDYDALEGV